MLKKLLAVVEWALGDPREWAHPSNAQWLPVALLAGSVIANALGKRKAQSNANKAAAQGQQDQLARDRFTYNALTKPELERRAAESARAGKLAAAFMRGTGLTGLWGEDELKRRETPMAVPEWDDRMSGAYGTYVPQGEGGWGLAADLLGAGAKLAPVKTPERGVDYRSAEQMGGSQTNPFGQTPNFNLNPQMKPTWMDDDYLTQYDG